MTDQSCVANSCGRPTQVMLCQRCLTELVTALRMLAYKVNQAGQRRPGLCQDLDDVVTRQTATGSVVGGVNRDHPLPFHVEASELADVARNTVTTWARDFAESNPHLSPQWTSVASAAEWMATFPTLLSIHPAAKEMHDEVTHLERSIRRMVDRAPDKIYLGKCGSLFNEVKCEDDLYGVADRQTVKCKTCGAEHDAHTRWTAMQHRVRQALATAAEISGCVAQIYGTRINVKTIRTWADRGIIRTYQGHGERLFLVGEVLDTAERRVRRTA